MKRYILAIVILTLSLGGVAFATPKHESVNICHKTGSESHPWEAIQIDSDALETHLGHGDFLYNGAVKDNGKPTKGGNAWCGDVDEDPETPPEVPPVVPPVTPSTTPSTTETPVTTPKVETHMDEPVMVPFQGK